MMFKTIPLALLLAIPASAGEVKIDGHMFRVPDGFTVEKVAGPGLVDRPIVADFDEQGRLYVADSSGSNDAPEKQLANPTHRIVLLEDTDNDGKYDKSIVFADKMMFPEGAMWRDGSLYVAAPPSIWKLTDTDGDGTCDKREEWFKGKTLTGCANDLHGPYNGPDGYIYWTKGAFAEQTYSLPNGKPFKTRASHIFRAKPDGSNIEPVMTGGMDNPVEVAWSSAGEMFFTTTFLQHPGGGKRDGIIHAVYGGLYGKDHDVLDGHIRTGPDLMPVMTHLGPAAPSGLMRYESPVFGTSYKDNLFCAQFNMHKVSRHVLEPVGATFKTSDHDFLTVAEHHDFHPTDVLEDADGSVLVLDTGGWYKLCCPTSQIGKPDVLGAIYRVRKIDAPRLDDPRGLRFDWSAMKPDDLARHLDDPRPAIRRRAIDEFGQRDRAASRSLGDALMTTLRSGRSVDARRNTAWASVRLARSSDRTLVLSRCLEDNDPSVLGAAAHVAGLGWGVTEIPHEGSPLARLLAAPNPSLARAAAEAMGHRGEVGVEKILLDRLSGEAVDPILRHSIIFALIELGVDDPVKDWLKKSPTQDAASLIATDQAGGVLPIARMKEALDGPKEARDAAEWIAEHRPAYRGIVAEALTADLDRAEGRRGEDHAIAVDPQGRRVHVPIARRPVPGDLADRLARFSRDDRVVALIGDRLARDATPADIRLTLLQAAGRSGRKQMPDEWVAGIVASLRSADPKTVRAAVAVAKTILPPSQAVGPLAAAIREVAESKATPDDLRLDALGALPGGLAEPGEATFAFLRDQIDIDKPVSTRLAAADVLAKARLSNEQLAILADSLRTAGPLDAPRLLAAFDKATDDATGGRLVAALKDSSALASLRVADLKPRFAKFGDPVRKEAEALYVTIDKANADQLAKLDDLAKAISDGDIRRGQAVFNGSRAGCLSCHAIGYVGGTIGPDLSRVGAIRTDRDLLESIVFPSASFVRSYEPMVVATKAGQVHSGIVKKDAYDELVLVAGADKEVRIPRAEVDEMSPGTVSVMPSGLDAQMTRTELADLIAFLKSRK